MTSGIPRTNILARQPHPRVRRLWQPRRMVIGWTCSLRPEASCGIVRGSARTAGPTGRTWTVERYLLLVLPSAPKMIRSMYLLSRAGICQCFTANGGAPGHHGQAWVGDLGVSRQRPVRGARGGLGCSPLGRTTEPTTNGRTAEVPDSPNGRTWAALPNVALRHAHGAGPARTSSTEARTARYITGGLTDGGRNGRTWGERPILA